MGQGFFRRLAAAVEPQRQRLERASPGAPRRVTGGLEFYTAGGKFISNSGRGNAYGIGRGKRRLSHRGVHET